uniref:C-type lectin domain-containing protein n=1 Tax=Cyprinus carpio TaxID=7962 RepID=A0A8C1ZIW0_CYPCA
KIHIQSKSFSLNVLKISLKSCGKHGDGDVEGERPWCLESNKIWSEAQSYCRQHYTDLPTIHNSGENNQINQILLPGYHYWISLFLDSWEWSDKWSRFFRHWAAGQPSQSSGTGDCVGMSRNNSGRWSQYSCDLKQPFICYGGEFFQLTGLNYSNGL